MRPGGVGAVVCVGCEQGDPVCHARQATHETLAGASIQPLRDLAGECQIEKRTMKGGDFVESHVPQDHARCQARARQCLVELHQCFLALVGDDQIGVQRTGQGGEV